MVIAPDPPRPESVSYLEDILDTPEHPELRRLTTLVEHLFQVPVAYMALIGKTGQVVARVGEGTGYAPFLSQLGLDRLIDQPLVVGDSERDLAPGIDFGGLRFAASTPLRSSSGIRLGLLVIADLAPRPTFSSKDARTLADLASVLAGKMELRMIASLALESELSLRQTERRFRAIANCAPVLLIYSGADGGCLFVNETWLQFSGRSLEEELDDGWADLIHPDYHEQVVEKYWQAFGNRQAFSTEAPFRRRDGQYRWVLGKGAPRFRDDGTFAGYVGCLLDITGHHDNLAALRQQSQFTAAIAEAAGVCYLILDSDGRVREAGAQWPQAHRAPNELAGCPVWEVFDVALPSGAAIQTAVGQAVAGRKMVRLQTAELAWAFTPIDSPGDGPATVIATVCDARGGAPL